MVREEERIFNDPGFGGFELPSHGGTTLEYFLHSCTLKHFKQFFPRHSAQTLTQLKYPYPNPNQIEMSLPKP